MKKLYFISFIGIFFLSACELEQSPDGPSLFSDNCADCHGPSGAGGIGPNIQGKTGTQIKSAIATVNRMSHLQGKLSEDEINAISDFLASSNATSKPLSSKVISGKILPVLNVPGDVHLKDNIGNNRYATVEDGSFQINTEGLQLPYMLKYSDTTGRIYYSMVYSHTQEVNVSGDDSSNLTETLNASFLFESCTASPINCFTGN